MEKLQEYAVQQMTVEQKQHKNKQKKKKKAEQVREWKLNSAN